MAGVSVEILDSEQKKAIGDIKAYATRVEGKVHKVIATTVLNVHAHAVRNVVVDMGFLKGSIVPIVHVNGLSGEVGTNKEYAARIEFGFNPNTIGGGVDSLGRRFNQSGQPYLFPAAESQRNDHARRMKKATEL